MLGRSQRYHFMCKHKLLTSSVNSSKLVLKVTNKKMNLVAVVGRFHGILPQNILEHSMSFHGNYLKRCLLTHRVSQILYLTKLISEIKYIESNRGFTTIAYFVADF
jgi:hypothetical protein